jgi:hypothetical protein
MENATRRNRKARKQGLAARPAPNRVTGRRVPAGPSRGADLPGRTAPNARKQNATTRRKAKRGAKSAEKRRGASCR